jgi:hypothetical protein
MSDINRDSPTGNYMRERYKINNLLFASTRGTKISCPFCLCFRLTLTMENGKRVGRCLSGCGQWFDLEKTVNEETGQSILAPTAKKYTTKFSTSTGGSKTFILSQKSKRETLKKGELSEEDKRDLNLLGSSGGEGATKVDERSFTYDQGGWR